MPSYLRRAILQHVIGLVSSAYTRDASQADREDITSGPGQENKEGKVTAQAFDRTHYMPVFYKDNMYRKKEDRTFLKLYNGKDWVWLDKLLDGSIDNKAIFNRHLQETLEMMSMSVDELMLYSARNSKQEVSDFCKVFLTTK